MKKTSVLFFGLLLFVNLIAQDALKIEISTHQILTIYVFLFSLTVLTEYIRDKIISRKSSNRLGLLAINLSRILLSAVFLLPHLEANKIYVYNFIICYLTLIFYSVFINRKQIENK